MKQRLTLTILFVILATALAQADPISYQARLTDEAGEPLTGVHALEFSLYSIAEGGSPFWTESHNPELDGDGLFAVLIGDGAPLDSLIGSDNPFPFWLEIAVDGTTLAPRRRVAGAARAVLAQDAQKLGGMEASEFAMGGHAHDDRYPTHLVLENSDGDGPNQGTPRVHWDVLHGVPATFVDGAVNWNELVGVPQGFADNVDNVGSGGGTLDAAYDYGGAGAGNFILADSGPVHIRGLDCLKADTKITVGGGVPGLWGRLDILSTNGTTAATLTSDSIPGGRFDLFDGNGNWSVELDSGTEGASMLLSADTSGSVGINMYGDFNDGGYLRVAGWGNGDVILSPGWPGDSAVDLPDSSVAAQEILDEPGLARSALGGTGGGVSYFTFDGTDTAYQTVLAVTITIPKAGYVLVRGSGTASIHNCNTYMFVQSQIDTTEGGYNNGGTQFTGVLNAGTSEVLYLPVHAEDVFYRQAGAHTFYYEATTPGFTTGSAYIDHPNLTAIYLPTSYGTVQDHIGNPFSGGDLRQLELRDARARAEAERARRELAEARLVEERRSIGR